MYEDKISSNVRQAPSYCVYRHKDEDTNLGPYVGGSLKTFAILHTGTEDHKLFKQFKFMHHNEDDEERGRKIFNGKA